MLPEGLIEDEGEGLVGGCGGTGGSRGLGLRMLGRRRRLWWCLLRVRREADRGIGR